MHFTVDQWSLTAAASAWPGIDGSGMMSLMVCRHRPIFEGMQFLTPSSKI